LGNPVIATRWGGPADYVDDRCGILVPPDSVAGFVAGLADAIVRLTQSSELRSRLGLGGLQRVKEDYLAWDAKADRVLTVLNEVLLKRDTDSIAHVQR